VWDFSYFCGERKRQKASAPSADAKGWTTSLGSPTISWVTVWVSVKVIVKHIPYGPEVLRACQVFEYTLRKRSPMLC